ncbi:hypothetical protein CVS42_08260 [Aeromonas veronii]|uniref:hypothetical protein n=1 Tax=Aeromonas TaxID=642 RepID=UPI0006950165|nr:MULTISPECIES: hypothetical protein [Aeromonas]ATY80818.1 hypothetical protein CVS42_08260 [Aeromonas veronii]
MNEMQMEDNPPRSGEPLFRYIAEQYQALQQEPVLYQWRINHRQHTAWCSALGAGIGGMLFGLYLAFRGEGMPIFNLASNTMYGLGLVWIFYDRYLISANKIYQYHITSKGIYYTVQDDIPEIAFTIMRGVGWFGCIACVLAAGLLGPAAFIGAGASALLAWKIKDMKPELKEEVCLYSNGDKAELTLFEKGRAIKLHGREHISEFGVLYCLEGEYQKVLKMLYPYLDNYEVHEVDSWRAF